MTSSQQVGFSFQGDVTNIASAVYSGAGRLLKSLDDAGVGLYVFGVCVQLGATISIPPSKERSVHELLQKQDEQDIFLRLYNWVGDIQT